ncbi:MAG TPA: hypothetical protein EYP78_03675 [Candidatus Omnitrophica bacterium]|nr:hypothetical protein [Candidatus Omnitrophota bacterium]
MTSRERVRRAILFQKPDRVPFDLPDEYGTDFLHVGTDPDPNWKPKIKSEEEWEDEWGCIWRKLPGDITMGQVSFYPLSDYAQLEKFRFPDYKNPARYASTRKAIAENKEEKFVLASVPLSFIHRLEYLRGHEAAWTDPYLHPQKFEELLDKLADIAIDAIENFSKIGADGIISCDDWGLQDRLMVRPELWRKFWKSRYKRVYRYAHQRGMLTFLHSCGYITDIVGDLIDAELDVIQMDQQENMGIERLSRLFGGKICFWCPVDIQSIMNRGSIEDIKNYAKKLIDYFGKFNGGFIAKWYPSPDAAGHSWERIRAMSEAFLEYGKIK